MGTKVEGKRYIPEYYTMGHFNLITKNNNWQPYYEEKLVNSQNFYNEFAPSSTNGYTCYSKEMLKQTILQHEATFRKQVYELHRLYKRQKDLMDSYKRRDFEKSEGLMWKIQYQSHSIEKPFSEFGTGAPTRNGSVGLDLNEPGTDCSDVERSSVNFTGFQGITEEGTSMNNYYSASGEVRNGSKLIKGEINGQDNGMDYCYLSTNFRKANGSLSQHENNLVTAPWLKQEQTNNHVSIVVQDAPNAPSSRSVNESRSIRDLDLNLNESLPEEEPPPTISNSKIERGFIDLNDSLPWTDELGAPAEVSVPPTGPQVEVARRAFEIDLEAPAVCEEEVHDLHATAAAEAILDISASVPPHRNNADILVWFADVATSNKIEIFSETAQDISSDESSEESFEALALKLEETKLEEGYHGCVDSKLHEVEMQDVAAAVNTRTVPRRGRRRQKKDFQKDILPGLVHLKKREVTEDLQIFGKVGPTKRVGRKPKNAEPDPVPAGPSCQTNVAQVASEGLVSALGWGQITRRCRKQRLPPGKVSFNSH